jgi:replication factor A1
MVLLARKHSVDVYQLIDAFADGLEHKVAHCGPLKISCRSVNQTSARFLVERGEQVAWQFPVNVEHLRHPNVLKKFVPTIPQSHQDEQRRFQTKRQIADLKYGLKHVDITATVKQIPSPRPVLTRYGSQACVSNATIADDTGSIQLTLWNNHITNIHVGDEVELKNCYVSRFNGRAQIRLGRHSTLTVLNAATAQ